MNSVTALIDASKESRQFLLSDRGTDHNGMRMGSIDLNVLEICNEFFGNEKPIRTFPYLGHDGLSLSKLGQWTWEQREFLTGLAGALTSITSVCQNASLPCCYAGAAICCTAG